MPRSRRSLTAFLAVSIGLAATAAMLGSASASATPPDSSGTTGFARYAVDQAQTGQMRYEPRPDRSQSVGLKERDNAAFITNGPSGSASDPVQQTSVATAATTSTTSLNFVGLGFANDPLSVRYAPPDTNGDVGGAQYVQAVNTQFAVFAKATGAMQGTPFYGSSLFTRFGGAGTSCAQHDDGDPVVRFDRHAAAGAGAGRWIITQFQVTVQPYLECVAISDTEDALGAYKVYAYGYGSDFVDYPKVGIWRDAYNVTYNVFANGSTFTGGEVCGLDRAELLAGRPGIQKCVRTSTSYPSLLASDSDDAAEPAGDAYVVDMAGGALQTWRLHHNFTDLSTSTLTGPTTVSVASFSKACSGGGTCIPQPGTQQKLDSLGDRLMNRLAYRVVNGQARLVVTHAVTVAGATRKSGSTGVRWYELRPATAGAGLAVYQQGTYAPDATHRWLSSAAMDKNGSIAVGYSASSSSVYPSIRVAGRTDSDLPLGALGAETVLQVGLGSQSGQNLSRWGDYASMTVDPADDCTMWFTTEYLTQTGAFNWSTRIMSFKLPGCP